MAEKYRGRVKWFNADKGFGFIERDNGRDIFFHYSALKQPGFKTIANDAAVEFEIELGSEQPRAVNIIQTEARSMAS